MLMISFFMAATCISVALAVTLTASKLVCQSQLTIHLLCQDPTIMTPAKYERGTVIEANSGATIRYLLAFTEGQCELST